MNMTGRGAMRSTRSLRLAGGVSFVRTVSAPVLTAVPAAFSSFSGRRPRDLHLVDRVAVGAGAGALGDDGLELIGLGRGLEHQLAADRQADPADAVGVHVRALLEEADRRLDVAVAAPAEDVGLAVALALAAAVEHEHAVAVAREHACGLWEPLRPGKEITAAPFFEGTYQPLSVRPSLVSNETSS